ncbi:glycosyltransferase [Puerhibacterium puerhi]|uniref:glycosyltransferase n=1 Tax=Puerhibacterium puerhi TaxID=2692623 RepID=UPI0013591A62|nr:glycosyltransferase [Puerhibacterium puerhi]
MGGPLRVLVVGHSAQASGAELALERLLAAVDPARVQVTVLLLEHGPLAARLAAAGVPVDVLPLDAEAARTARTAVVGGAGARQAVRLVPLVARLALHVRRRSPDLVVTTTLKSHVLGTPAALLARRPVVWHVHDRVADDYLPRPVVLALRAAARRLPRGVVANSAATAATLPGARGLTVAYPGFAPAQALDAPERHAEPPAPVVLLLGRVSPTKGQLELVRAAARVLPAHPTVRFRMVGAPLFGAAGYAAAVDREVERLGLAGRVERVPPVDDPAAELDAATVLVHASPVPEPFGQVVVEAMVRGVPVVATDAGGVPEILAPDGPEPAADGTPAEPLGLLVPPGDVGALAAAIAAVLADPAAARRRAAAAHAAALRRFGVGVTAEAVMTAWERAAAARTEGPTAVRADRRRRRARRP